MITISIPGEVRGKGRPRAARRGKHVVMIADEATASYENRVALFATQAMAGQQLIEGPVRVSITATLPIPGSWSNKRRTAALAGLEMPTSKPDIDNIAKAIFDGLNGVIWMDDKQIVESYQRKRYGIELGAIVTVEALA